MPLGFERLNERTSRPNAHINFIKPLPGPTETTAQKYLERVAAIMYPIMKSNYIYVMSLEEYEPNPEFAGRNFNAGEVIQLVLKARNGAWLPFGHVQMVMVHELAHCKQMNHSRFFWQVRNQYAEELRSLWAKRYTGEGLWGRGRSLEDSAFMSNAMPDASLLPENVCGGTYRSRGRKRRRKDADKPQMSYAEKQQRRILKKFGDGGVTLGSDEEARAQLEAGKKTKGKPRVASSARGRELRAAAVMARLEKAKEAEAKKDQSTESDTESEYEWPPSDEDVREKGSDEILLDSSGHGFVRVCEEEDPHDEDVEREMQEILEVDLQGQSNEPARGSVEIEKDSSSSEEGTQSLPISRSVSTTAKVPQPNSGRRVAAQDGDSSSHQIGSPLRNARNRSMSNDDQERTLSGHDSDTTQTCLACSLVNEADAIICTACSNVLQPNKMPNNWKCQSITCRLYTNIGDYGRCQICGAKKPTSKT